MLPSVHSILDLRTRALRNPDYKKLAISAANNLGGDCKTLDEAIRWLNINADETDERGVVEEINFCRDLIK